MTTANRASEHSCPSGTWTPHWTALTSTFLEDSLSYQLFSAGTRCDLSSPNPWAGNTNTHELMRVTEGTGEEVHQTLWGEFLEFTTGLERHTLKLMSHKGLSSTSTLWKLFSCVSTDVFHGISAQMEVFHSGTKLLMENNTRDSYFPSHQTSSHTYCSYCFSFIVIN